MFSKAFENQTAPVRPEVWQGIQAKMAAAGVAGAAASKGVSLLTKWLIGSGIVGSVGVAVTVLVVNSSNEKPAENKQSTRMVSAFPATNPVKEAVPASSGKTTASKSNETTAAVPAANMPYIEPQVSENPVKSDVSSQVASTGNPASTIFPTIKSNTDNSASPASTSPASDGKTPPASVNETLGTTNSTGPGSQADDNGTTASSSEPGNTESMPVLEAKVVKFPNVFTPNNDGDNDYYSIQVENIEAFEVTIMNQKNQIVYRSNDPQFKWYGMFAGEPCENGVYVCIVTGKDPSGKPFKDMQLFEIRR